MTTWGSSHSDQIHLYGEPKSGTSWVGTVVERALEIFCTHPKPYIFQKWKSFTLEDARNWTEFSPFGCIFPRQRTRHRINVVYEVKDKARPLFWTSAHKHYVGNVVDNAPCRHVNGAPAIGSPCMVHKDQWPFTAQRIENYSLAACVEKCLEPDEHSAIYVIRDPRDTAVSMCNFENYKELRFNGSLPACLRLMYPRVVLWTKYREMVINVPQVKVKTTLVCYEEISSTHTDTVLQAYYNIFSRIGLTVPDDDQRSHSQFLDFINSTTESSVRSNPNTTRAMKLDAGSKRHYTSESLGLSRDVIDWINATYRLIETKHNSPCKKYREAVGLL